MRSLVRHWFVGLFVALAILCLCKNAAAGYCKTLWHGSDADGHDYWIIELEHVGVFYVHQDYWGNVLEFEEIPEGNPDPDDGTTTPGDLDSWKQLAKQKGGGGLQGPALSQTPLGKYLAGKGKGVGPHHNPNGDPDGGLSPSGIKFKNPMEDGFVPGGFGGAGVGFSPNGGPIREQLGTLKRKGKKNGGDDGSDGGKPEDVDLWGYGMPGPPELVNPDPGGGKSFVLLAPTPSSTPSGAPSAFQGLKPAEFQPQFQLGAFGSAGAGRTAARPTAVLQGGR